MARISTYADSQVDPTLRCRTRDLRGFGLCAVLAIAVLAACQPDSDSITGVEEVEGTLDHHPERQSCHFAPEAIKTVEDGDEVVLIEFEYGGGEIWDPGGDTCQEPDSMSGVLLAADGVSYSDSVGGDGDFLALKDCTLSTAFDRPCNVPSLINALSIDALLGYSGYLRFDPPISEISFMVCSSQSHGLTAWDSLGNLVVPETAGQTTANPCAPEDWVSFGIESPTGDHNISRVRLRRWDPGLTWWDDMTFRREAPPAIECIEKLPDDGVVTRGEEATCRVRPEVLENLTAVTNWSFEAVFEHDGGVQMIDGPDADSTWSGVAVTGGTAHAWGHTSSDSLPLHGELVVAPRSGPDWKWPAPDSAFQWADQPNGGMQGCSYGFSQPIAQNNGAISFLAGVNARRTSCDPGIIDPSIHTNPTGGFTTDSISDQGPNNGLVYVASAEYFLDRGSVINPWLLEQGPGSPVDTITKKDSKDCPSQWRTGPQDRAVVNTYTYNVECKQRSLAALHAGIHRHEGNGSGQLNGHRAQRLRFVHDEGNVPHAGVEAVVDSTSGFLLIGIGRVLDDVEDGLHQAADPAHILVHGNWQEDFYIQSSNGHFHDRTMNDGN